MQGGVASGGARVRSADVVMMAAVGMAQVLLPTLNPKGT